VRRHPKALAGFVTIRPDHPNATSVDCIALAVTAVGWDGSVPERLTAQGRWLS
jgi:hypothetical protein